MTVKSNLCCTEGILQAFKDQESFREEVSLEQGHFPSGQKSEASNNHPELNSISPEKVKRQRNSPASRKYQDLSQPASRSLSPKIQTIPKTE